MIYSQNYGTFLNTTPYVDGTNQILYINTPNHNYVIPFVHQRNRSSAQFFYSASGMFVYFGEGWTPVQLTQATFQILQKVHYSVKVENGYLIVRNEFQSISVGQVTEIKESNGVFTFYCDNGHKVKFALT